jgi:hypothetical protein
MTPQSPFEIVYTAVTAICPQLAAKNTHIIHEWITKGFDVTNDILPAIKHATKNGSRTIQSFAYFSGFIRSINEHRVKEQAKPVALNNEEIDKRRAKTIEIRSNTGMYVPDSDWKWLNEYKERNKAIA